MDVKRLEEQLGVRFADPNLLKQALTHRSFVNEYNGEKLADNERLEFLGDAILDFVVGDMLYKRYPDMPEGELTRLRAALVRTEALAELAEGCDLGEHLLIGKGEENSGGRKRQTNLCSTFEAVVGALYLDRGLEAVADVVLPRLDHLLQRVLAENLHRDARSDLQEWSQAELSITPSYRTAGADGPDHDKEFMVEATIEGRIIGRGVGRSKQSAAQAAARAALKSLERGELRLDAEASA